MKMSDIDRGRLYVAKVYPSGKGRGRFEGRMVVQVLDKRHKPSDVVISYPELELIGGTLLKVRHRQQAVTPGKILRPAWQEDRERYIQRCAGSFTSRDTTVTTKGEPVDPRPVFPDKLDQSTPTMSEVQARLGQATTKDVAAWKDEVML